jgi:hypothetical protein
MSEGETQTIAKDFFDNVRESSKEKVEIKKIVGATILDVSDVKYNPENGEGEDKKPDGSGNRRKFKKFYFTLSFALDTPLNGVDSVIEHYGFRFYEDKKEVWYGSDKSACGRLVNKLKKYTEKLPASPSVNEVLTALLGRKVNVISEEFGPNKSKKIMVDAFL